MTRCLEIFQYLALDPGYLICAHCLFPIDSPSPQSLMICLMLSCLLPPFQCNGSVRSPSMKAYSTPGEDASLRKCEVTLYPQLGFKGKWMLQLPPPLFFPGMVPNPQMVLHQLWVGYLSLVELLSKHTTDRGVSCRLPFMLNRDY